MSSDPEQLYNALLSSGRLAQLRRLTYRCADHRCLLLDAVETPLGMVLHQVRFKQSESINLERSNEAGRAKNTFDGNNHWMPRSYWIEQSALHHPEDVGSGLSLQCDHVGVPDVILSAAEFSADWAAQHAEVRVRRDGSRYAAY